MLHTRHTTAPTNQSSPARRDPRRQRSVTARLPVRQRPTRRDCHQRWLEGIPRRHERALHAPRDIGVLLRWECQVILAPPYASKLAPPGDLTRQALADGHHAELGQPRAPPSVLRRVGVPIQPPTLTTPRTAVLPPHLPSRRQRPSHLRRPPQVGSHQTSPDRSPSVHAQPSSLHLGQDGLPWRST